LRAQSHRAKIRRLAALAAAAGAAAGVHANDSSSTGADTYAHICQGCHMAQGQGAVGAGHYPKLAGDPALVSWQYMAMTVLNGKNGMPSFGLPADQVGFGTVRLSDAQVADVVNYVRSHFGNKYKDKTTPDQIAALPHPDVTSGAAK
jgi:mono/diheme cytochrome c family protein